jgi:hypothetical protein
MIFYLFLKIIFDINILKQFKNIKKIIWRKKNECFLKLFSISNPYFICLSFLWVARTITAVHRRILWCGAFDVRKITKVSSTRVFSLHKRNRIIADGLFILWSLISLLSNGRRITLLCVKKQRGGLEVC